MGRKYFFILIILLGSALRLYHLGAESLWYDEVGSIDQATQNLSALFFNFQQDPPFYHLLLKYWIRIFGITEVAVRMLSCIFSIFSLYLAYKISYSLFNKRIALISTLLLALSPFHIFYSQEARYYILSFFLALLSVYIFLKLLNTNCKRYYYFISIINTLNLYTNPLSLVIIIAESIILLRKYSVYKKLWIGLQFISLSIFLFWAVPALHNISMDYELFKIRINLQAPVPSLKILVDTFETFIFGGLRYGGSDYYLMLGHYLDRVYIILIKTLSLFLFFYAVLSFFRKRVQKESFYFIFLWLTVSFVFSLFFHRIYSIRYFLICLLPFYILIAVGIEKTGFLKGTLLSMLIISLLSPLYLYYSRCKKINWKDSTSYINQNIKYNDTIIISPSKQVLLLGYYSKYGIKYNKAIGYKMDSLLRQDKSMAKGSYFREIDKNYFIGVNDAVQLASLIKEKSDIFSKNQLWLVVTRWTTPTEESKIRQYLEQFFALRERRDFTGVSVYRYKPF